VITARGEQRLRTGHPWIYRADVADVDAAGGDIVEVIGPRRRTLGHALFSDRSQIPIRMLARGDTPFDTSMLRARLARAIQFRDSLAIDATAYRVVHGEADLLPSLVIDRYGAYLVLQALSQGMDRLLTSVTGWLSELLAPEGILARNDPKVRALEGLEQTVEVLAGSVPNIFDAPSGCRFHPRCPVADPARCASQLPPVHARGGHAVACIHGNTELPA